jgi:rRNA maturation endonuclease Nob1
MNNDDWIKSLGELIFDAGVDLTLDGGETWLVRHVGCNYFALDRTVCNKCGDYVKRETKETKDPEAR